MCDEASALRLAGSAVEGESAPVQFVRPDFGAPLESADAASPAKDERKKGLHDLLRLQHVAFVGAAYEAILRRPPDPEALHETLRWLASGGSKIQVLGGLRYSDEGRIYRIRLPGLAWRFTLERMFRIPLMGTLLQIAAGIIRLPAGIRHRRALEFAVAAQGLQDESAVSAVAQTLRRDVRSLTAATEAAFASHSSAQEVTRQQLVQLARVVDASIVSLTTELLRIGEFIAQQAVSDSDAADEAAKKAVGRAARANVMDAFYAEFEQVFRGSREEIKDRIAVYLPLLERAGVGGGDRPVVDLGCGRGEWLEVLKEHRLTGTGIDLSSASCTSCRDRGLDVVQADALSYIAGLPDGCLGAITGMHIIEHLPFEVLLEIVDQAVRVLQPGGLLIFETPNPGNVLVATNSFYLDPTHRNPIPSALLRFLMESRGLARIEILELKRYVQRWASIESEMDRYLVDNLFGAEDYATIGRKPIAERLPEQ